MGKQPSLMVSASEPITPPDPALWLPALGTTDAHHGQAATVESHHKLCSRNPCSFGTTLECKFLRIKVYVAYF